MPYFFSFFAQDIFFDHYIQLRSNKMGHVNFVESYPGCTGPKATVYNLLGLELGALKMKDHVQTVHMNNFIIDEIIYVH